MLSNRLFIDKASFKSCQSTVVEIEEHYAAARLHVDGAPVNHDRNLIDINHALI